MDYLIDSNIILDKLLKRRDVYEKSNLIVNAAMIGKINGYISVNSITDIYYILRHYNFTRKDANSVIQSLLTVMNVLDLNKIDCQNAVKNANLDDFEDAVLVATAKRHRISMIITRNPNDFINSGLIVFSPEEVITKHDLL